MIEIINEAMEGILFMQSLISLIQAAEDSSIEISDYIYLINEAEQKLNDIYFKLDEVITILKENEYE